MNNIYLMHQLIYVENFGYVLVMVIEGKDLPQDSVVPQKFLLSGVN